MEGKSLFTHSSGRATRAANSSVSLRMFERSIIVPHFGQFVAEGQSKLWCGSIALPLCEHSDQFSVQIRGLRDGPANEQIATLEIIVRNCSSIKSTATQAFFSIFSEAGLLDQSFGSDPERIWDYLQPNVIEVEGSTKEWDGAIYAQIGFTSLLCPSVFPYIETLDGKYHDVSAES